MGQAWDKNLGQASDMKSNFPIKTSDNKVNFLIKTLPCELNKRYYYCDNATDSKHAFGRCPFDLSHFYRLKRPEYEQGQTRARTTSDKAILIATLCICRWELVREKGPEKRVDLSGQYFHTAPVFSSGKRIATAATGRRANIPAR